MCVSELCAFAAAAGLAASSSSGGQTGNYFVCAEWDQVDLTDCVRVCARVFMCVCARVRVGFRELIEMLALSRSQKLPQPGEDSQVGTHSLHIHYI